MSERLLLSLLLSVAVAGGLAAQDAELDRLRRRVAALEARRATLTAAIARRDSLELLAQRPTVVGKAPLFLRVPEWAAPLLAPDVDRVVDDATAEYGDVFHRARPETLTVAYRPIPVRTGAGMVPVEEIDTTNAREEFLAARRFDVARMASARVDRLIGPSLLRWIGGRYDGRDFEVGRRRTVLLLAGSSSGVGDRCLKGETPACLEALGGESGTRTAELRASLFRFAMDRAGTEGWQRFGIAAGGSEAEQISAVTGRTYPILVAEWGEALRGGSAGDRQQDGRSLLALVWGLIFVGLFGWRLTWHRV
jgi:hypothetical protein